MSTIEFTGWILLGAVCYVMAGKRGRSKELGLLAGILFGVFAIMYYLLAGDTQELKAKKWFDEFNNLKKGE